MKLGQSRSKEIAYNAVKISVSNLTVIRVSLDIDSSYKHTVKCIIDQVTIDISEHALTVTKCIDDLNMMQYGVIF